MVDVLRLSRSRHKPLSVLALSSRFDGRQCNAGHYVDTRIFQYSLCRVVLMVAWTAAFRRHLIYFQYSLCRVVLMVAASPAQSPPHWRLSVLALSSRFDGRLVDEKRFVKMRPFSTRSVESF